MLLITFISVLSCSKKDNKSDVPVPVAPKTLAGSYVVLDGFSANTKSVYIDDKIFSVLSERENYATRGRSDSPIKIVSETEVLINTIPFSVSWDNNKLTLTYSTIKYVLLKESSMPSAEEWVTTIDPVFRIEQPTFITGNPIEDLAYYNGFVYTSGHADLNSKYVLTKINPSDFSHTDIPIPAGNVSSLGYSENVEYVGSNKFWVYDWGSTTDNMFEFSANSLEKTKTILMPNQFGYLYQLGGNETALYGAFKQEIRKWDFIDQKWGNKIQLGEDYTNGLDVDDEYMYVGKRDLIHKYSLNTLKAVGAYNISMNNKYLLNGFTLVGKNKLVASVYNFETQKNEIVSITLP